MYGRFNRDNAIGFSHTLISWERPKRAKLDMLLLREIQEHSKTNYTVLDKLTNASLIKSLKCNLIFFLFKLPICQNKWIQYAFPFPFAEYNLRLIPYDKNSHLPIQHSCAFFIRVWLYCVQFIKLIHLWKRRWARHVSVSVKLIISECYYNLYVWVIHPFICLYECIFIYCCYKYIVECKSQMIC